MEVLYSCLLGAVLGTLVIVVGTRRMAPDEARWLARALTVALALRLLAAAVFATFTGTRLFHEDASGYEALGMMVARGWHGMGPSFDPTAQLNYGFIYVAGAVYYVFGQFQPLLSCFNCVLGIATILLIYRMARFFFHPLVARRAALLSSLMPSMILWSSVAMKDALVTCLVVLALYCCISLKRRFSVRALLGLTGALVAMQPIRFYIVYFVGLAVVISLFMESGARLVSGVYKQMVIGGAFIGFIVLAGIAGKTEQGVEFLTFERVSRFRHGMAVTANSGFDADVDVSTPGRALLYLPVGLAELLLGPFPWQFGSLRAAMAAPETIYWWLLFPSMIRGLWWMIRKRFSATSPLIVFAAALSCAYSLVHGNVGSGFRQRAQIFVVLFLFAALGAYRSRCRRTGLDPDLLLTSDRAPMETA